MKKMMLAATLLLCFSICACCSAGVTNQARQKNDPPEAKPTESAAQPDMWDFGAVSAGSVLKHEFVIVNTAAKDLVIKDTTTSCGCTVSEIKKKRLLPGESTTVSIKLDTKGYTGDVQQFVYVNTDSIDKPIIRFTVKAKVLP
jgi:hypothetical protein